RQVQIAHRNVLAEGSRGDTHRPHALWLWMPLAVHFAMPEPDDRLTPSVSGDNAIANRQVFYNHRPALRLDPRALGEAGDLHGVAIDDVEIRRIDRRAEDDLVRPAISAIGERQRVAVADAE